MASQLLCLRLLSYRGAFVFRLKTLTFTSNPSFLTSSIRSSGGRLFSSREGPPREGRGFRLGREAAAGGGGQAKSLIEDEAELSDWVSDLKTDSFRLGLSGSDNEEEGPDQHRRRGGREDRIRSRGSDGFSARGRSRGSGGFSERNSRGSLSKRRFGSDLEEEEEKGGWRGSRRSNGLEKDRRSGGFSERKPRGSVTSVSKRRFGSDLEDEDDEEEEEKGEFLSRQRGGRGSPSSFGNRGGRNGESSYKQGGKSLRVMSEEEEEDEEDDDEDESTVDGYGSDNDFFGDNVDKKVATKDSVLQSDSSAELGNRDREKSVPVSSGGHKDSYLSNTR